MEADCHFHFGTSSQLPWHDPDGLIEQAAIALELSKRDILRVQAVPHRPLDYTQVNLYCILLQRAQEFRPSPYVRLTLIDLELHVNNDVQPTPFRRFPKWMPYVTTREDIFANLGIAQLRSINDELCHLWRNNVVVEEHSTGRIHLSDGDYVKIYVGDLENFDTCLSDIDLEQSDAEDAHLSPAESHHRGFF